MNKLSQLKSVKGTCDNCQKENTLIQKSLIEFDNDEGDPGVPMNLCKNCFIKPCEEDAWCGFEDYTTDDLEKVWEKGRWCG